MYAQTIAYGLLSARITDPARRTADDLAAHMRTNPFLRELMQTFLRVGRTPRQSTVGGQGIDFDELGVSEVMELLDQANMEAVVRDFGDRNPQEDPVIHFYEHFLAAYDKQQKVNRGVFYTPRPVVSYIVRSCGRASAHGVRPRRRPRRHHHLGRDGQAPERISKIPDGTIARRRHSSRSSILQPAQVLSSWRLSTSSTGRWRRSGRRKATARRKSRRFGTTTSRSRYCRACTGTNS